MFNGKKSLSIAMFTSKLLVYQTISVKFHQSSVPFLFYQPLCLQRIDFRVGPWRASSVHPLTSEKQIVGSMVVSWEVHGDQVDVHIYMHMFIYSCGWLLSSIMYIYIYMSYYSIYMYIYIYIYT